jgi:hypothetical protein
MYIAGEMARLQGQKSSEQRSKKLNGAKNYRIRAGLLMAPVCHSVFTSREALSPNPQTA